MHGEQAGGWVEKFYIVVDTMIEVKWAGIL